MRRQCLGLFLMVCAWMGCSDDPAKTPDMTQGVDMAKPKDMAQALDMRRGEDQAPDMKPAPDQGVDMAPPKDMTASDMASPDMADAPADMPDLAPDMPPVVIQGADTCAMAADVTQGVSLMGLTTVGAADDYDSQGTKCPVGRITGNDVAFFVMPAQDTTYKITVTPMGRYNPMIYIKTDCAANACLDGTVLNGPGVAESLTTMIGAGVKAYIIVDGDFRSGDANGAFNLEVTPL